MDVLVVEDDIEAAQIIVKNIEQWGYNAEIAGSGKEALEKIREKKFDVAVIDIFLPDVKGYELIPQFKDVWHDIWIVTMTGYNTRELEMEVRGLGIVYYMTKPFEAYALKEILDHWTKKREADPGLPETKPFTLDME